MPRVKQDTKTFKEPQYWTLLSEKDQQDYIELRDQLFNPQYKNRRNQSNEVFKNVIDLIKRFVVKNDENDWKRSLVCGTIWLKDSIAINTHQLRLLVDKCKSSINGSFQAIGYSTIPAGTDSAKELIAKFPFMRDNFGELRQWTIRQKSNTVSIQETPKEEIKSSLRLHPKIENPTTSIEKVDSDIDSQFELFTDKISPPPDFSVFANDAFGLNFSSYIEPSPSPDLPDEISPISFDQDPFVFLMKPENLDNIHDIFGSNE